MDRKKRRGRSSASDAECDEIALAKAAAWAWHQRGSLHNGRAPRPHEPRAAPRPPRPSRYQLEARAAAAAPPPSGEKKSPPPPPPRGSISLFDLYEIECITRELERLIAASDGRGAAPKEAASDGRRATRKAGGGSGGFLGRHAATICGGRVDAVEATAPLVGQRRRSKVL